MKKNGFVLSLIPVLLLFACNNARTSSAEEITQDSSSVAEVISPESKFVETQFYSSAMGQTRTIAVYIPANYSESNTYKVIYTEDGLVFATGNYKELLDSLIAGGMIQPVIVACSYENKDRIPGTGYAYRNAEYVEDIAKSSPVLQQIFDSHMNYFLHEFIPYIESNYSVSKKRDDRIYYGTSNSADFGLTLSFRSQDLFAEYWCFSPVYSVLWDYAPLAQSTGYFINWGTGEQKGDRLVYFHNLTDFLKKSGGNVRQWTFNGGHDRPKWREEFSKLAQERLSRIPE